MTICCYPFGSLSGRYPGFWVTWEVCPSYQMETWVSPFDLP